MEIRFLNANDASRYWKIRLEALECEPEAFGASAEEHRASTVDDAAARLSSDPANNFVVGSFLGERLVGTAGFFRNKGLKERHKGHIWGVYVTRAARGKRAGRDMLRMLLERAISIEGIEQIMLSVATTQDAAVSLYRSLGFESFGCERRALKIGDRYVDEENMVLYLKPLAST
ncbi:MAG: GNAT family N-acetyltransferase [Candidatus Sulfotelmatobacter sp.]|jgi:ribosomal protein S18 acetylase RimI-like enzyme